MGEGWGFLVMMPWTWNGCYRSAWRRTFLCLRMYTFCGGEGGMYLILRVVFTIWGGGISNPANYLDASVSLTIMSMSFYSLWWSISLGTDTSSRALMWDVNGGEFIISMADRTWKQGSVHGMKWDKGHARWGRRLLTVLGTLNCFGALESSSLVATMADMGGW